MSDACPGRDAEAGASHIYGDASHGRRMCIFCLQQPPSRYVLEYGWWWVMVWDQVEQKPAWKLEYPVGLTGPCGPRREHEAAAREALARLRRDAGEM